MVKKERGIVLIFSLVLLVVMISIEPMGIIAEPTGVEIDPSVIDKLSNNTWVNVITVLKDDSRINYDKTLSKEENYKIYWQKAKYFEQTQQQVLDKLLPKEFKLKYKYHIFNGFSGNITKEGLEKLKQDSVVLAVLPNRKVKAFLQESLPLINATKV